MTSDWREIPLGELCEVLDHRRKPVTQRDRLAGPYPYYGATGIQDYVAEYIFDEPLVLVGEDGAKWGAGESTAFAVSGKCWVNNHAHVLRPRRDQLLDKWLIHYLNHSDLSEFVSGLTVPKLNQGNLREIPVPVPPLRDQHRIVAVLDGVLDGIATAKLNSERNLKNSRDIFEAYVQAVFNSRESEWTVTTLGNLSDEITDGTHNSPPYAEVGIPMLDSKHIREGFVIDDSAPEKFILPSTDSLLAKRCKPRAGDILISSRGSIGKIAIVEQGQDFNIMGNMILVRLPEGVSREFVAFFLHSRIAHMESIARGVAQKGLYLSQIREYEIPLPSVSEQTHIGDRMATLSAACRRIELIYERKIALLGALKNSALHQVFTRKL